MVEQATTMLSQQEMGQGSSIKVSPVGHGDPIVRALNTMMYGLVVHVGTMWAFGPNHTDDKQEDSCRFSQQEQEQEQQQASSSAWWASILLAHEYWVYLQHMNVLANPLCQHLDRQYGIALLRSNQHWAIAGTLSAYWCRETLSMFLCLPFVSDYTRHLVLYSLIYHTIKSRGVRQDALRRYSPTFGIMRIVIDHFYHHTYTEQLVSLVRLFLQGLDTFIHAMIISDLFASPFTIIVVGQSSEKNNTATSNIHCLFAIWVLHAACNQWFTCSTATIMVQAWNTFTAKTSQSPAAALVAGGAATPHLCDISDSDSEDSTTISTSRNGDNGGSSTSSSSAEENNFVVRRLLRQGRVPDRLKGKQGAASNGVDNAIRLETIIAIIAAVYAIGLGDTPFRVLLVDCKSLIDHNFYNTSNLWVNLLYGWLLYGMLSALSVLLLPTSSNIKRSINGKAHQDHVRRRSILFALDVAMIVIGSSLANCSSQAMLVALSLGVGVTVKSFLKSTKWRTHKALWMTIAGMEIFAKALLGRLLVEGREESVALVGALVCTVWGCVTVAASGSVSMENTDEPSTLAHTVADAVFLGHPAELSDCWALWLLPYSLDERWRRPWWAVPLWPFHYVVGYYMCNFRAKLFGDGASFFNCDDVKYEGVQLQTWTAAHFGRHFMTSKRAVRQNIEAAARHADDIGVKVLCLGALNKAESINAGGVGVARALGENRRVSIIHGNHLTAAAVVETTHQCFGENASIFLTGASSKVGWAVARALRDRYNYTILCHSTDQSRRDLFKENGFLSASTLHEGTAFSRLWIVGKNDTAVAKYIPQGATAVVFSVPHPLHARKDVRVLEAGTLHMDLSRLDRPRRFTNKLEEHEIFACHAAGVVAAHRLKQNADGTAQRVDEIGPVEPDAMDSWLDDAKGLGFRIPVVYPLDMSSSVPHDISSLVSESPPVVIVGGGPAGLATAAAVRRRGVHAVVLEEQTDPCGFGSWDKHFSGLTITTQKRWCNLPGFAMDDRDFPGETVDATAYTRYLRMYAERFDISILRGHKVDQVVRGGETAPWIVKCGDKSFPASAVVVATGKNRIPRRDTSDKIGAKMVNCGIQVLHSTDLRSEEAWEQSIAAARAGKLCVVGFGNSAADLCTAILQSARCSEGGGNKKASIHIAARTIPPVFPRSRGFLRVDTIGVYVRLLPSFVQELATRLLWWGIPSSAACDAAFPAHLPRWNTFNGRVPVIDKFDEIASALRSGSAIGHGQVRNVSDKKELFFEDGAGTVGEPIEVDVVIMATGYEKECIIPREDSLNGMFLVGFGSDKFLPLKTIGEEAERIAKDIAESEIRYRR